MHQTRQETTTKLPIPRKGTKYVARAASNPSLSIPVVIAIRNLLGLAKTAKEVKKMIIQKLLKINGKHVEDMHESICLFDVFEAGKTYTLTLSSTKKFIFEETPKKSERLCKVVNKRLVKDNKIQLNLHDGSNILADNKIKIGDSLYLDFSGKIKKHISPEKGKEAFVISGKYAGINGKIEHVQDEKVLIKFKEGKSLLAISQVIVL
jgi:small subunit ribosomal protein S4e